MATTAPQSILANGVVSFTLKDGTTGIVALEAQRTLTGQLSVLRTIVHYQSPLTSSDDQAKLILQGARLAEIDLEKIWQLTETINAPGFPDGSWTQLEMYVALHFCQAFERLSLNQMAIQYAGSLPPETTSGIRRRSSYAEAGLALRPPADHDPMPALPNSQSTAFRHSTSFRTTPIETKGFHTDQEASDQATFNQDNSSISQPGLETMQPFHASTFRHLGGSENLVRTGSLKTDTTTGPQRLASLIRSRCPNVQIEPDIERFQPMPVESGLVDKQAARDVLVQKRREDPKSKDPSKRKRMLLRSKTTKQRAADSETWVFQPHELSLALREAVEESSNVGVAKMLISMGAYRVP